MTDIGVRSGKVMTVTGPVPVADLGVTLMHEHILLDGDRAWRPTPGLDPALTEEPVRLEIYGELRMNPYMNRDNVSLRSEDDAAAELGQFRDLGGRTVVDPTNIGIGRDGPALRRISEATGLQIVMGSGFYLEFSHPEWFAAMDVEEVTDLIVRDVGGGPDAPEVTAGLIGEIGVSKDFTPAERKSLTAAARASARTGVPLMVHLPGWERLAHEVLDVAEAEGVDLNHLVLCHMNPSHADLDYQTSLARRGAYLEYDMIGMDYYYADQDAQSPSDEENARAIRTLVDAGHADRVLLSQDVFMKMMLTRYGGFGYGYIQRHFVPRLMRHGVDRAVIDAMLTDNPRRVFGG